MATKYKYPSNLGTPNTTYMNFWCYKYESGIPNISKRNFQSESQNPIGDQFNNFIGSFTNSFFQGKKRTSDNLLSFNTDLTFDDEVFGNEKTSGFTTGSKNERQYTISLYLPPKIESKYSADWQKMQFGALGAGFGAAGGVDYGGVGGAAAATGASYLLDLAKGYLQNTPQVENLSLNGLVGATLGISFNDNTLQTFNKMNPRTFDFEYIMIAKNKADVDQIKDIIKNFKISMHPGVKNNPKGLFLDYPFVWRILPSGYKVNKLSGEGEFDGNNKFLEFLPKTDLCALIDLKVDYTPDNNISLNQAGFVQAVRLNLSFIELITLTQTEIKAGY